MKVGDLVRYTCTYSIHKDCVGKIGIILKTRESDSSCTKGFQGQLLYKIAMSKDGYIIDNILASEIEKFE